MKMPEMTSVSLRCVVGYVAVLAVVFSLHFTISTARDSLLSAGDKMTYEVLVEQYHWVFVVAPLRVDDEQTAFYFAASYMYPLTPQAFLPNVILQYIAPEGASPSMVYETSVFLTLLLLSFIFFIALQHGLGPGPAAAVTAGFMVNPFLIAILVFAPVLHSSAFLVPAYLLYRYKRWIPAVVLFAAAAFSYRAGSLFLLLFLLALREEDKERRALNRVLVIIMSVLAVYQIAIQFTFLAFNESIVANEGTRIEEAMKMEHLFSRVASSGVVSNFVPRLLAAMGWLVTCGGGILLGRRTRWHWVLAASIGLYIFIVVGSLSQAMILFVAMSAVLLIRAAAGAASGGEVSETLWRRWRWGGLALGPALVIALTLPVFGAPGSVSEWMQMGDERIEKKVTATRFCLDALALQEAPHVAGIRTQLDRIGHADLCAVDLFSLPLVTGRHYSSVITLGLDPAAEVLARADAVLIDESPGAKRFRSRGNRGIGGASMNFFVAQVVEALDADESFERFVEEGGLVLYLRSADPVEVPARDAQSPDE